MPTEHHIEIRRSARYFTLGDEARPRDVWFVLHGYGQLAERFVSKFAPLDDGHRLFVAPEALSRHYVEGKGGPESRVGASWMTREDRMAEMADYVRYLDAVHDEVFAHARRGAVRLSVLGFSQGAATAARWVLQGKGRVDRVVLWAGLLPPDVDPQTQADRLNALDLVLVAGDGDDGVAAGLPLTRAALDAAGVRYRVVTFPGGHELDGGTLTKVVGGDVTR